MWGHGRDIKVVKRLANFGRVAAAVAVAVGLGACSTFQSEVLDASFWSNSPLKDSNEAELGLAELAKGNYVTAEGHFQKALKTNPQDLHALIGSGILYQNTGQDTKAREMYEAVLALRPDRAEQFVIWNSIATRPISEIASVNLALLETGETVSGMQRNGPAGQRNAEGQAAAPSSVQLADAVARIHAAQFRPPPPATSSRMAPAGTAGDTPAVGLNNADSAIVSRFKTLRALRDQHLIAEDEYASRRAANVGALLPLTAPPPAAGLDRPVPSTQQITGRLRAIGRALEMRALSVGQHSAERAMILDALMPASPAVVANPPPPPDGVMEAADAVRRLEHLKDEALISSDEQARERTAIDTALRGRPAPAGPAAAAAPTPLKAKAVAASGGSAGGPMPAIHLASYRSQRMAQSGWERLRKSHGQLLGGLEPQIARVDLGKGKGIYFRLKAGPLANKQAAATLCRKLKARNQYCQPTIAGSG